MRTIERIRNYLETEKKSGRILPGGRLPSYHELMKIGEGSYATVLTSMKKLQAEGLVEIRNGSGSFLAGGKTLKICISHTSSTISSETFAALLSRHAESAGLNMEFDVRDSVVSSSLNLKRMIQQYDALFFIQNQDQIYAKHVQPQLLFSFRECEQLLEPMEYSGKLMEFFPYLPFTHTVSQIGVNSGLLKKVGFSMEQLTPDFLWWNEFREACSKHRIAPIAMHWRESELFFMKYFFPLLLSFVPFERERYWGMKPLFTTDAGLHFLQLLKTMPFSKTFRESEFYKNASVFQFALGSWIALQNNHPEWPQIKIRDLEIIPHRDAAGHKICYSATDCIGTFLRDDLSAADRGRLRELLSLLLSHEFQLEYCNKTGMLSFRREIAPTDYAWNKDGRWNAFFPEPDSFICFSQEIFPDVLYSVLSSLLEGFLFYGIDLENTAKRMDDKKKFEYLHFKREFANG